MSSSNNLIAEKKKQGGLYIYPMGLAVIVGGYKAGYVSYAVVILSVCMCLSGIIMHIATAEPDKNPDGSRKASFFDRLLTAASGGNKFENENLNNLVTIFQTDAKDVNESYLLLGTLKKKLRANEMAVLEAANLGLVRTSANFVKNACTDDKRIPPSLDIINTILTNPKACALLQVDENSVKELVDSLVMSITTHMRPEIEIELVGGATAQVEAAADGSIDANQPTMTGDDDEDVDFDFSDKVTTKQINRYFYKYGHKLFMALGLLVTDNIKLQTLLGDRGAINVLVACLMNGASSPQIVKWIAWSMINIVYEHPPNKRDFFVKGGLNHLVAALAKQVDVQDAFQQCIALLLTMVAHDKHTKMNQSLARQTCLGAGIFEYCQKGKKNFPENGELHNMIDQLLKMLISDWS